MFPGTTASTEPPGEAAAEGTGPPEGPALRRVGVLILGVVLGLLLFDRGLAWFDSSRDLSNEDMLVPDAELAWTNRPGYTNEKVYVNALGLRGPEIPADAPPTELRILGTGPSTTFGAGEGGPDTEHTWAASLERMLPTLPGGDGPERVINGGVPGYSVIQACRRALALIPKLHPDLVLVFVSPGSQALMDPSGTRNYVRVDGELVPSDIAMDTPRLLLPAAILAHEALSHSALYSRWRLEATDAGRRPKEIDRFVISRAPHGPEIELMLTRTWADLAALAKGCREAGVELRALLVPEPFMDCEAHWHEHLVDNVSAGAPPVGTPRVEPIEVLDEKLSALGITCWSFHDALTVIGGDRKKFTGADGQHWSAAGHDVIAATILRNIKREGLLETLRERRQGRPRSP